MEIRTNARKCTADGSELWPSSSFWRVFTNWILEFDGATAIEAKGDPSMGARLKKCPRLSLKDDWYFFVELDSV